MPQSPSIKITAAGNISDTSSTNLKTMNQQHNTGTALGHTDAQRRLSSSSSVVSGVKSNLSSSSSTSNNIYQLSSSSCSSPATTPITPSQASANILKDSSNTDNSLLYANVDNLAETDI